MPFGIRGFFSGGKGGAAAGKSKTAADKRQAAKDGAILGRRRFNPLLLRTNPMEKVKGL